MGYGLFGNLGGIRFPLTKPMCDLIFHFNFNFLLFFHKWKFGILQHEIL